MDSVLSLLASVGLGVAFGLGLHWADNWYLKRQHQKQQKKEGRHD